MSTEDSNSPSAGAPVTVWLKQLKAGDQDAAARLWQRYVERLIRLAARHLRDLPRRVVDEEDVVLSAFHALLQGVEANRFPCLNDRDDLWRVLAMLTERKARNLRREQYAMKRGGGQVRGESALIANAPMSNSTPGIGQLAGCEPTPQFAAQAAEELSRLLNQLADPQLRQIALDRLAGYTNRETAQRLGTNLRAVERKVRLIRITWEAAGNDGK